VSPGVFGYSDAVSGAGAAMPQLQVRELSVGGVGGERGDPESVDVGEAELRPGVGPFVAGGRPHPFRPALQVQQSGELGEPGAVADVVVGVAGRASAIWVRSSAALSGSPNPTE
jgi:hypothetical protein